MADIPHTGSRPLGQQTDRRQAPPNSGTSTGWPASTGPLVIDCDSCSMRGLACGDCMVTVLLGGPPFGVALDDAERRAIDVLVEAGLIPPLRMVQAVDPIGPPPD